MMGNGKITLSRRNWLKTGLTVPAIGLLQHYAYGEGNAAALSSLHESKWRHTQQSGWVERIRNDFIYSTQNGLAGAVCGLYSHGNTLLQEAYGFKRIWNEATLIPTPQPMTLDTLFDLASLTKIFSTTLAWMKLIDEKQASIDDKVAKYIPTFACKGKENITLKQLMQHNSGFASGFSFYNPAIVPKDFYSQDRDKTIHLLPLLPLQVPPGTKTIYSDLNFMTLGIVLEAITKMRQDDFVSQYIYQPMGLSRTGYRPLTRGFMPINCEATERCGNTRDGRVYFPNIRTKTIQGEVQDETVFYSMGQIAGNAGLFSTVGDLTKLGKLILNKGNFEGFRLCSPETVDLFIHTPNIDNTYALGFQFPTDRYLYGELAMGRPNVVCHTGWTGKCFLIDFDLQLIAFILMNKKHSPVLPVGSNLNIFEADLLPVSSYGNPLQLFYAIEIHSS